MQPDRGRPRPPVEGEGEGALVHRFNVVQGIGDEEDRGLGFFASLLVLFLEDQGPRGGGVVDLFAVNDH